MLYVLSGNQLGTDDSKQALFIAGVLVLLWGANIAADSLLSEIRGNTWDAQRMSATSAWRLVWGKLLGSSVFPWYGAAICLAIFAITTEYESAHAWKVILIFISAGLFAQAVSMMMALMSIRKSYTLMRSRTMLFTLMAASTSLQFILISFDPAATVHWFGQVFYRVDFSLYSVFAWLGWSWFACYQLMRAELQIANRIWPWLAFILWLIVFTAGFIKVSELVATLPYLVVWLTISLCYLMIFSESKNPVVISRLLRSFYSRDWQKLQIIMPSWLLSMILMLFASVLLLFTAGQESEWPVAKLFEQFTPTLMVTMVLFTVRDVCIVLWMNFSLNRKRADITAILYLSLSYLLMPMIFSALSLDRVRMLFLPIPHAGATGLIIILFEVALFFWLMQKRWQMNFGLKTGKGNI